jgi:tetratricopeptide (TPR) repeat protein
LNYLYRLSLLNRSQVGNNRFVFHPLIRLFARELGNERSVLEDAAERHALFFVQLVKSSDASDLIAASALADELDDIVLAAEWLQRKERADYEFVIRLEPFFERYGHWRQAVLLMAGFLSVAERIEDWDAAVQLRIQQAKYLSRRGELPRAEEALAPIADIVSRIESHIVRQRCEAMVLNSLGGVYQRQGRFEEAVAAFERSYTISEELGDQRSLAMVLNSLGGVYQRQGQFEEAVAAFERSVRIGEELDDNRHLAMVHTSLGNAFLSHGAVEEAAVELRKGFEIDEDLENRRGLGIVTPMLAEALLKLGRSDEAVSCCQRALAVAPRSQRLLQLQKQLSAKTALKQGSVKRIIRSPKGHRYGFVTPDDGSPDIYFREGFVEVSGLAEGARVEVEVEQGPKGPRARSIKIVD